MRQPSGKEYWRRTAVDRKDMKVYVEAEPDDFVPRLDSVGDFDPPGILPNAATEPQKQKGHTMKKLAILALICLVGGCAAINRGACWVDNLWEPCEATAPAPADDTTEAGK